MINESNHIIRKVSIGLNCAKTDSPFQMQEDVAGWWNEEVLPVLQSVLNEFNYSDEIIQVPRLDIIIDTKNESGWRNTTVSEIAAKFKEQLSTQINTARKEAAYSLRSNETTEVLRLPATQHILSILHSYLLMGLLPWTIKTNRKADFVQKIKDVIKNNDDRNSKDEIVKLLRENTSARARLSHLLDDGESFLDFFTVLLPELAHEQLKTWNECISILARTSNQNIKAIYAASNIAISNVVFNGREITTEIFIAEFKLLLIDLIDKKIIQNDAIKKIALPKPFNNITEEIAELKLFVNKEQITQHRQSKDSRIRITENLTEKELQTILEENLLKEAKGNDIQSKEIKRIIEDGIYISNAGLVIAAPFLNALFEKIQIARDFKILDINKAVCLTGYIVNGNTQQPEYELLLPKLLCGVAPEQVVNTSVTLDDGMLAEADEMLNSLIEYWSVLKDTSPEGLREFFLKRDGKLSFKNNEWLLQVEQKAYDMLLQQIPWNYHWIKLPWMPNLLKTEWVS